MGYGPSGVYILDMKGKGIIHRAYRRDAPSINTVSERFTRLVLEAEEENIRPVFLHNEINYMWIKYNNLFIVGTSALNANAMMVFAFLYKLAEVFSQYFGELEEESMKDNFVITYELLDEMLDNGYPQTTEHKVLMEYIKSESHRLEEKEVSVPVSVSNAVSWRTEGIKHKKNEVFVDVIEKLNLLVASNGTVLRSEILGVLKMRSLLSGMPELKLGLNDKLMFEAMGRQTRGKSVELEDIKFHQCVRLARFESDRTISFIPPDGEFELMSYRLSTAHIKPLIWVEARIEHFSSSRLELVVKTKSQFKTRSIANSVDILIPVPNDAASPNFKCTIGQVRYDPTQDSIVWTIRQFQGQKEFMLRASFSLPSVESEDRNRFQKIPIRVTFEIPYFTVSGIQVRYLKILEKSGYQALPWVRYITQNGDYQIRMF